MIQVLTGTSYGLLQENVVPLHTTQILIYSFIYNDITTIFSMLFRINHHEKSLIQNFNKLNYSKKFILFCNLIAVVFTIDFNPFRLAIYRIEFWLGPGSTYERLNSQCHILWPVGRLIRLVYIG